MKKIFMDEFIKFISDATEKDSTTRVQVTEYDEKSIFSVKKRKTQEVIFFLEIPEENKYETFFEELKKHFEQRYQMMHMHDFGGRTEDFMIIDEKVWIVWREN